MEGKGQRSDSLAPLVCSRESLGTCQACAVSPAVGLLQVSCVLAKAASLHSKLAKVRWSLPEATTGRVEVCSQSLPRR